MAKTLKELIKPKLSNYEKAEVITKLPFYEGGLEPQDICEQYTQEELDNMYIIGKILEKYQMILD